jgi:hypothetical protein
MEKKPEEANIETEMINIQLPKVLIKRAEAYCAENEISIHEFINDAITEKIALSHQERRKKRRL